MEESFFKTLLDECRDGVWVRAAGGEVLYANVRMGEILGVEAGALIGKSVEEFEPSGGGQIRRLVKASGGEVWVSCAKETQLELAGRAVRFEQFRDISGDEHFEARRLGEEERLRERWEQLALAMGVSEIGLWDYNPQSGAVSVSPEYARLLGHDPGTFVESAELWYQRIHPEDAERVGSLLERYLAGEVPLFSIEFRMRTASGGWLWCHSIGRVVKRDGGGKPARMIGTTQNIEARKRAEEERLLLTAIVDSSPDFVGIARITGEAVYINKAGRELVGLDLEEDLSSVRYTDFLSDRERTRMAAEIVPTLMARGMWRGEILIQKKSGETFVADVNRFLIKDQKTGSPIFFGNVMRDATARKRAEEELLALNNRLEERVREEVVKNRDKDHMMIQQSRLAAMGEMIGNIAHQWRQPLNALGLILANLGDAFCYGELTGEYLQVQIEKATTLVERMSNTIDDFRNFFQPAKASRPFVVYSATNEALSLVRDSFQHHGITLRLGGDEEALAEGFPNEYSQAILNLALNARDVILERRVRGGVVDVLVARELGRVTVSVEDNGGGIPADVMPRIFDPYFTTRDKGTGIGLYMSRTIIEKNMNGRLLAENTERGARFTVVLPEPSGASKGPNGPV